MTDGPLVRRIVLHGEAECRQLWDLLRQRGELAKRGKVLQVTLAEYAPSRALVQNRKMWKAYLEPIAEQARANGHRLRATDWHQIFKAMFLPEVCASGKEKWKYEDDGDRTLTMSSGDLNEDEFDSYLHEIGAYATTELGAHLPANPRDYEGT